MELEIQEEKKKTYKRQGLKCELLDVLSHRD